MQNHGFFSWWSGLCKFPQWCILFMRHCRICLQSSAYHDCLEKTYLEKMALYLLRVHHLPYTGEPEVSGLGVPFLFSYQGLNLMAWPTSIREFMTHVILDLCLEMWPKLWSKYWIEPQTPLYRARWSCTS